MSKSSVRAAVDASVTKDRPPVSFQTIRVRGQPGRLADPPGGRGVASQLLHLRLRASVLPDDRGRERPARLPVPDEDGLALVRDADAGQPAPGPRLRHGLDHRPADVLPDLDRVVLDPTLARVALAVRDLHERQHPAVAVHHGGPRAGGPLVDTEDEVPF
jgi:hypothetical protein